MLRSIVGTEHVLTDPELKAGYETDWTRRYRGCAPAVVRPGTVDELAAVAGTCANAGVPVVPQGGNTGLVGGGVPVDGEVVISTNRLVRLDPVNTAESTLTAGAGVTLEHLQSHAKASGLAVGIDTASRSRATLGGMVATNAGGTRVLRHGHLRRQLRGIQAILGNGQLISHLDAPIKDNTGYDLAGLLCGSEGTLGIITAATLQLHPITSQRTVALVGLDDVAGACRFVTLLRNRLPGLAAVELMFRDGMQLVCDELDLPPVLSGCPTVLLVEASGQTANDDLTALLSTTHEVIDATVSEDAHGEQRLWAYREAHTEAIGRRGPVIKLDVAVPLTELPTFLDRLPALLTATAGNAKVICFGHLADSNVHINILDADEDPFGVCDAVFRAVASHGGSISAEHGIGRAKMPWLHLNRSVTEIAAFRSIKRALDPAGIMNPNVLVRPTG